MLSPHDSPAILTAEAGSQTPPRLAIRNLRVTEALSRFAGDESRYRHWLSEFIVQGPAAVSQIRMAISNGSPETAERLAHAFKGRTGLLGMAELHSIARTLEMALKNCEPTAFWIDELERTAEEMSRDISEVLGDGCV